MRPQSIPAFTATSCLGRGLAPTTQALLAGRSGLAPCRFETVDLATFVGEVPGLDEHALAPALARFDCRNNRLADLALSQDGFEDAVAQAAARHGPARVGVFMGTSTAGILSTEIAYRHRDPATGALPPWFDYRHTHNTYSVAQFVRERLGLRGPCAAQSTACASSAKVFASAARMIEAGLIDAAVVGGVDTLCLTTLYGFHSLELLSAQPCRPWDAQRNGISIGEGAGYFLLDSRPAPGSAPLWLLGAGESSDAHHMSSPHPEGLGARLAMESALACAGLAPKDIDYVNLHGTATPANDVAEDKAVHALFGDEVPCNSTKGATGHALGAAGALEAVISLLALRHGFTPASPGTQCDRPAIARALRDRARAPSPRPRDEQLLRLWRLQLQPRLRDRAGRTRVRLAARVVGVGTLGPGIGDWEDAREVLRGARPSAATPTVLPAPEILPPAERRRCGRNVRLAIAAGLQAVRQTGRPAHEFATVFTSSNGDGDNLHAICEALASEDRLISPTRFHNSVHNAPAGYWGIATHSMKTADSLCACDGSFGAGLLEALLRLAAEPSVPVLVIAYDVPYPEPIHAVRPVPDSFAVALALAPGRDDTGTALAVDLVEEEPSGLGDARLEALRRDNPAARSLPLLALLASGGTGRVVIEYLPGLSLAVEALP